MQKTFEAIFIYSIASASILIGLVAMFLHWRYKNINIIAKSKPGIVRFSFLVLFISGLTLLGEGLISRLWVITFLNLGPAPSFQGIDRIVAFLKFIGLNFGFLLMVFYCIFVGSAFFSERRISKYTENPDNNKVGLFSVISIGSGGTIIILYQLIQASIGISEMFFSPKI
ncbi:MAG: hypothetical protein K8T10_17625 [Candidatus Eremiobacteraeota bacterium]|nr:hypothetical protein [Candidatus Eremiobacteraeota bacterium]